VNVRVGLIGCGDIAGSHLQGYVAAGASVVAVTDVKPEAAEARAKESGARVYADYRALIDEGKVQAVSICTPPVAHEEAAVYALRAGVHVLCEKPMAFDIAAAHRMREAARQSSALLMPAFRHRFLPAIIALRDLLTSGKIGEPVLFDNVFCGPAFGMEQTWFTRKAIAGGGSVLDTSSHSVDLFRFLVGEIAAQHLVAHRRFQTTDVEDAGILTVRAENGALGAMHSAFVAGAGVAFIDVLGTKGQAHYDYYAAPNEVSWRLTKDEEWTRQPAAESWGFSEEVVHFLGAVEGKHPLAVTVEDGVRAMEVICSAYDEQR
jgi:predicted dehydrogenase